MQNPQRRSAFHVSCLQDYYCLCSIPNLSEGLVDGVQRTAGLPGETPGSYTKRCVTGCYGQTLGQCCADLNTDAFFIIALPFLFRVAHSSRSLFWLPFCHSSGVGHL